MTIAEASTLQRHTYLLTIVWGRGPHEETREIRYTTPPLPEELARDAAWMRAHALCTAHGWGNAEITVEEVTP